MKDAQLSLKPLKMAHYFMSTWAIEVFQCTIPSAPKSLSSTNFLIPTAKFFVSLEHFIFPSWCVFTLTDSISKSLWDDDRQFSVERRIRRIRFSTRTLPGPFSLEFISTLALLSGSTVDLRPNSATPPGADCDKIATRSS